MPTNAPAPASGPRERLVWSLLIFAGAFLIRVLHVVELRGSRLHEILMGDSRSYDGWAREIAAGDWLGSEVFYQAPLYPYFLAVLYRWLSDDPTGVRVLQSLLGAGSCVLLARAGWHFFSTRAGGVAGLLLAGYAPAVFADTMIEKSALVLFLLALALAILGSVAARPRAAACLALGAAVGALALARENALVFAPVLFGWLALRRDSDAARRMLLASLFAVGVALSLAPVALRNLHVGGELHLTTSQLGPNLYIGNNPAAQGTYAPLIPGRGDPRYERADATAIARRALALGREPTPREVSAWFTRAALDYARSQPLDWLALMGRKLALAFNAVEIVDTEDQYTHAETSLALRLSGHLLHFGVLAPLALLGMWIRWDDRRRLLPLYLLLGAYLASLVAFYVFARYRLPLAPILALFAGAGLVGLPRFVRTAPRSQVAAAGSAAAVAAVVCNWPIVDTDYMRSVTRYNLGNELAALGRTDEAIGEYRLAISRFEGNAQAHHNLGALLAGRGDLASARARYERALAIAPGYVDARVNLARTLHETGDADGAIAQLDHALRLAPDRADAHHERGAILLERGELDRAIRSLERAVALDPELPGARADLARAREGQRGGAGARKP
jgi:tetratricopeptide (TPR) repeat protein